MAGSPKRESLGDVFTRRVRAAYHRVQDYQRIGFIGDAYGTTPTPLLRGRGRDGQLHAGGRALPGVAAVAQPAGAQAGAAAAAAAVRPAGPGRAPDRSRPATARPGDGRP